MVWKRVSRGENYRNEIESIPIVYVYGISFELSTRSGGSRSGATLLGLDHTASGHIGPAGVETGLAEEV